MQVAASIFLISVAIAHAQAPSFDVASVKRSPPATDRININLGTYQHGVVTLTNTTLSECVRWAYGLVSEDQVDGPEWIRDRELRVDIEAKTSPDTPMPQARIMMQNLLAQRFHLALHHADKPVRHFDLTLAKGGPTMPASPGEGGSVLKGYGRGRLFYDHLAIPTLAVLLSRQLNQTVVDRTGLTGAYNIHLEWMPDDPTIKPDPSAADTAPLPDIYRAIRTQLGLQLQSSKAPIDVLVIDHADQVPVAN